MRYLVLSDIHGNIDAFDAVLADAAARYGELPLLVLGDLVGYGGDPNGVIDRLRDLPVAAAVRGNHDRAACGLDDGAGFNEVARVSAAGTARLLTPRNREHLRALPEGPLVVGALIEICHGTPYDEDAYVFDEMDAVYALRAAARPLCLFGHTHAPFGARLRGEDLEVLDVTGGDPMTLARGAVYIINVGAVGQPRDGNPRAAYGVVDDEALTVSCRRVAYDVERAQARIREAGFPESLAARLTLGR
jgi:diadenosine tetraphosphatase ApaH/serine/threonine PP2A family protein phosphatase